MNSTPEPTDRLRALTLLEAADFLRDAHFRDGLSVQEIGTALRHMADAADPMVGSLARDGFGLDEIAAMPAAVSVAVPPTLERRDRYAQAIRDTDGWVLDDGQHMLDAVLAVADAEQTALRTRVACLATALGEAVQHVGGSGGEVSLQTFERWRAVRDAQPDDGQTDTRAAIVAEVVSELEALRDTVDVQVAEYPRYDARQKSALNDAISRVRQLAAVLPQPETQAGHDLAPLFEGFGRLLATSSRDWGQYAPDAWLYAVILGWDCEEDVHGDETCTHGAMEEMAERHGWDDATVAKARRYRAAVRAITEAAAPAVVSQPDEEA